MVWMLYPPEAWQDVEIFPITYHDQDILWFCDASAPKPCTASLLHWGFFGCGFFCCVVLGFGIFLQLIDMVNTKQEKKRASTSSLHSIHSHHQD